MNLTHFEAMLLFAVLLSVALAFLTKRTARERFRYSLWSLALFLVVGIAVAWLLFPFSH
ncbi:MAG: hypothetical protein ACRD50_14075 [Candidatus Acidiferrales bacterium]